MKDHFTFPFTGLASIYIRCEWVSAPWYRTFFLLLAYCIIGSERICKGERYNPKIKQWRGNIFSLRLTLCQLLRVPRAFGTPISGTLKYYMIVNIMKTNKITGDKWNLQLLNYIIGNPCWFVLEKLKWTNQSTLRREIH